MTFYAWTQDIPIDAATYREIVANMAPDMPGLVVHLGIERPDGTIRYLDVWESREAYEASEDTVVHAAVGPVLAARGIHVDPNNPPPREEVKVINVRFADGASSSG